MRIGLEGDEDTMWPRFDEERGTRGPGICWPMTRQEDPLRDPLPFQSAHVPVAIPGRGPWRESP